MRQKDAPTDSSANKNEVNLLEFAPVDGRLISGPSNSYIVSDFVFTTLIEQLSNGNSFTCWSRWDISIEVNSQNSILTDFPCHFRSPQNLCFRVSLAIDINIVGNLQLIM